MILIALGSNLPSEFGSPFEALLAGVACIDTHEDIAVVGRSGIYKSAPVPISDQPWYHNAVIAVETNLKPYTLLAVLQEIEMQFGRERIVGDRNAPRTLDLDVVAYDDIAVDDKGLQIPHPRMAERAFVLLPIRDLSSKWKHPLTGASIDEMIEAMPEGQNLHKIYEDCNDAV